STAAHQIAELDSNNTTLFWSPDSRYIGFFASGKLKKIDASGGPAQSLCDIAPGPLLATWNPEGVIVFGSNRGLYRVSASGGEPVQITTVDLSQQETAHLLPYFLPDGRHYLYLAWSNEPSHRAIYVGSLDSSVRKRLMPAASMAVYAEPGYLLFHR